MFNIKTFLIFFIILTSINCFAKEESKTEIINKSGKKIILYMCDDEQSGQVATDKENALYYRVLIEEKSKKSFLVQDFYISGVKQTDPYLLIDGKKKYVYNERAGTNYYPRQGKRVVWYESGAKYEDTNYKNNKEDGFWISWYEDGIKMEEINYIEGKIDGTIKRWNENGILVSECTYKLGKENGRCYSKHSINTQVYLYDLYYISGKKIGNYKK